MTSLLKRFANRWLQRYTLIISPLGAQCWKCGLWADPLEPRHLTVPKSAHPHSYPNATGCGAQWRFVTKFYIGGKDWPDPGQPDPLAELNKQRKAAHQRSLMRIDRPLPNCAQAQACP